MTKIMITEDNTRARRALKALLSQQAGISVIAEASDGQEAINRIKKEIPDAILMDVCMPGMDGIQATKIIKSRWSQIKIIILTMYPDHKVDALSAGADAFLLKGCPVEDVTSLLHSLRDFKAGNDCSILGFFPAIVPPQIV